MSNYWVIGGTSGIGAAVAQQLDDGTNRVFISAKDHDVRNVEALRRAVAALAVEGTLQGVVYSAGINHLVPAANLAERGLEVDEILDINLVGFLNLVGVLNELSSTLETNLSIVAISSDAATRPMRTSAAYCASKAGLDMAVRCVAREMAPNWRVNAVAPGMTGPTPMSDYIDANVPAIRGWTPEEALAYEKSQIPIGRRATPAEIAEVVCSVLHGPAYMTGSVVTVNGGR